MQLLINSLSVCDSNEFRNAADLLLRSERLCSIITGDKLFLYVMLDLRVLWSRDFESIASGSCFNMRHCIHGSSKKQAAKFLLSLRQMLIPDFSRSYYMIGYCHQNVVCLSVTKCFAAKRYILQQKCLNKWIGSALLGTWWCNFLFLLHRSWPLKFHTPKISSALWRRMQILLDVHYAHMTQEQITRYCLYITVF